MNASKMVVMEAIAQQGKPATTSEVQLALTLALWRITQESVELLVKEGLVAKTTNKAGVPLWTLTPIGWAVLMGGQDFKPEARLPKEPVPREE